MLLRQRVRGAVPPSPHLQHNPGARSAPAAFRTEGDEAGHLAGVRATSMPAFSRGSQPCQPLLAPPFLRGAQRAEDDVAGEGECCMAVMNPLCGTGALLGGGGGREGAAVAIFFNLIFNGHGQKPPFLPCYAEGVSLLLREST